MFDRAILHMDLDSFYVSVERIKDPTLGLVPLIIGGSANRGVVSSCSYEARKFGVHSAMPIKKAMRLCPNATVLPGDMGSYSKFSKLVTEVIANEAPVFQKASIDEFYLDLTGMDKHFGCFKWSKRLRSKIIKETGLPISFGLSVNKLVSKVATGEAKPNGMLQVLKGQEKEFLAPMSVKKIPGIGKEFFKRLSVIGVHFIHQLSKTSPDLLEREFGKSGIKLWEKANGIDLSEVKPHSEQKSMSKERTFNEDTKDVTVLKKVIAKLIDQLAYELRKDNKLASCVAIKLRYADFRTFSKQKHMAYSSNDTSILKLTNELFDELLVQGQAVRLIGVKFSGLVESNYQTRLFEDTATSKQLMEKKDIIRDRFGADKIMRASYLDNKERP